MALCSRRAITPRASQHPRERRDATGWNPHATAEREQVRVRGKRKGKKPDPPFDALQRSTFAVSRQGARRFVAVAWLEGRPYLWRGTRARILWIVNKWASMAWRKSRSKRNGRGTQKGTSES